MYMHIDKSGLGSSECSHAPSSDDNWCIIIAARCDWLWQVCTVMWKRSEFQCRQNDLLDWQAGQVQAAHIQIIRSRQLHSLEGSCIVSPLSTLHSTLSSLCWRQIYAWPDRFINWCAHCRRTSWPNGTGRLEVGVGSWQLRRRQCRLPLRAVAAFCGYFLIDIEMIYVCCLMSSHTQT